MFHFISTLSKLTRGYLYQDKKNRYYCIKVTSKNSVFIASSYPSPKEKVIRKFLEVR